MSWVAAGVAVVGGGIQMYQGYKQKKAGEQAELEAELNKPEFEIPVEEQMNLIDAQKRAAMGMPAAQRLAAQEDIQRTTSATLRGGADRRAGLGLVAQTGAQEQRANLNLMLQDVRERREGLNQQMQQRSVLAGYKMKRFEHEYNEYASDLDYARAQIGAGMQNQMTGMNTAIEGVGQGVQGSMDMARMAAGDPTAMTGGSGDMTNPSAQQKVTNPADPKAKRSIYGTDGNIFTGKKREAYNEYLDDMDNTTGGMEGVLSFKQWKNLNEANQTPIEPEGNLSYDFRHGGKRRIKREMRNLRTGINDSQRRDNMKSFFGFNTPYTPSKSNTFNITY